VWSGFYAATWVLMLVGIIYWNIAISDLVPELKDLPANLRKGFDNVFAFAALRSDSQKVKDSSSTALGLCTVTHSQCSNLPSRSNSVTSEVQKQEINDALDHSLNKILRVMNDPYIGVPAFKPTADKLQDIVTEIGNVNATNWPCLLAMPVYCSLYTASDGIIDGMADVDDQLNTFYNGKDVKDFTDAADKLTLLHMFPIFMVISALCFLGVWWRDGTCICCRDGTKLGCCMICCQLLWWLIFFIMVTVMAVVSIAVMWAMDNIKLTPLKGEPTCTDFFNHLQTEWPEFWQIVFSGLEKACLAFHESSVTMWVFTIVIAIYGCCMCCWRPYSKGKGGAKVVDESEVPQVKEIP
jgi:hypothetical protein